MREPVQELAGEGAAAPGAAAGAEATQQRGAGGDGAAVQGAAVRAAGHQAAVGLHPAASGGRAEGGFLAAMHSSDHATMTCDGSKERHGEMGHSWG